MFAGSSVTWEGIRSPQPIPWIYTIAVSSSDFPQHRKFEAWQQKSTKTPRGYFFHNHVLAVHKIEYFWRVSAAIPIGMTELSCKDSLSLAAYQNNPHIEEQISGLKTPCEHESDGERGSRLIRALGLGWNPVRDPRARLIQRKTWRFHTEFWKSGNFGVA